MQGKVAEISKKTTKRCKTVMESSKKVKISHKKAIKNEETFGKI